MPKALRKMFTFPAKVYLVPSTPSTVYEEFKPKTIPVAGYLSNRRKALVSISRILSRFDFCSACLVNGTASSSLLEERT